MAAAAVGGRTARGSLDGDGLEEGAEDGGGAGGGQELGPVVEEAAVGVEDARGWGGPVLVWGWLVGGGDVVSAALVVEFTDVSVWVSFGVFG